MAAYLACWMDAHIAPAGWTEMWYTESNDLKVDWAGIDEAPNEALVNALCMMSPFGIREKQAMLEAADLKTRAEILIAVTQMELMRGSGPEPTMQ